MARSVKVLYCCFTYLWSRLLFMARSVKVDSALMFSKRFTMLNDRSSFVSAVRLCVCVCVCV
jgi:hypothetical protein